MIDRITIADGHVKTVNADTNDVSKAPVYRKFLDGTTIIAANTPLGMQFTVKLDAIKSNLEGIFCNYLITFLIKTDK
jgi:hypothetical protein